MKVTKEEKLKSVNAELMRVKHEGLADSTNRTYFKLLKKIKRNIIQ